MPDSNPDVLPLRARLAIAMQIMVNLAERHHGLTRVWSPSETAWGRALDTPRTPIRDAS
jgi:hypothetical protein